NETSAAWRLAVESETTPTLLVLTRQGLPTVTESANNAYENVKKGAYVISKGEKDTPDTILIATGSEVELALKAQKELAAKDISVNVVSMPSWDLFEKQDESYKNSVLPKEVKNRLAIEMASSLGWERSVGLNGKIISVDK